MSNNKGMIQLTDEQRYQLRKNCSPTSEKRLADRSMIILAAEGHTFSEAAQATGSSLPTVRTWCRRFQAGGMEALRDLRRPGRPESIPHSTKEQIITLPQRDHSMCSCRKVAAALRVSPFTVHKVWSSNDMKPHLTHGFKLSNDPRFTEKFWDVVGLYLSPPDKAIVLCCDEKTQIQALERSQPGLPLGVGHVRTATHDYYRHGTTTLFAALNYLDGKLISRIDEKHTNVEWLGFLKKIDRETPCDMDLHLVLDNYATHKHQAVREWLEGHPRFHLHFTPSGSSWMNLVERFFRDITDYLRSESFPSLKSLTDSIVGFLARRNAAPKRYVWHKSGQEILDKIARAKAAMGSPET